MHDSNVFGPHTRGPRAPRTERHCFAFGGVGFEVLAEHGMRWQLLDSYADLATDVQRGHVAAEVICSVRADRALERAAQSDRTITFRHKGAHTAIDAAEFRGELREVGPAKFAARLCVAKTARAMSAAVFGLVSGIVERSGGLSLHAAAVELDDAALLFLGPSGAGKSTAAALTGLPVFANDKVNVALGRDGRYWAFAVPGGEEVRGAERSERAALPVAALARIRQAGGDEQPRMRRLYGAAQLFAVREAVAVGDPSETAEEQRLLAASHLCERAPLFELHTVLGKSIAQLLRSELTRFRATAQQVED